MLTKPMSHQQNGSRKTCQTCSGAPSVKQLHRNIFFMIVSAIRFLHDASVEIWKIQKKKKKKTAKEH